jgi:hypothetical protein
VYVLGDLGHHGLPRSWCTLGAKVLGV